MTSPLRISPDARIVTVAEMQAIERSADAAGHSYAAMMERAGAAVAAEILARHAPLLPRPLLLVGPGNNGGDGLVCARHLKEAGADVRVLLWKRRTDAGGDYEQHYAKALRLGVEFASAEEDPGFARLRAWLGEADVVVDALLGTGANRPIEGTLAGLLDAVRAARPAQREPPLLRFVAVDCPSGLDCDSGAADPHSLPADLTVTFAHAKAGHYRFPGAALCGTLLVADIGIPPAQSESVRTFVLTREAVRAWLPARPAASHKGTFGKLMAAAGSVNYPGAASLCLGAAGRVGAGLVTGAVPESIWPVVAAQRPEPTWLPLPAQEGALEAAAAPRLLRALAGYDALLLGCGLTQTPQTVAFVQTLFTEARASQELPPTLIDADGLNCLAQIDGWPALLPAHTVLTPHPAELARLVRRPPAEVTAAHWEVARAAAQTWQAVVLAKGPYTVIAAPAGDLAVLPVATPALATAGTGDVLSGALAGLLAQGLDPFRAACAAAWLHGQAGLLCAAEIGNAGVVAGDLLARLPRAWQQTLTG